MPMPPPNQDKFAELAAEPDRGPVVMLNLLRFETKAAIDGGAAEATGRKEYARYTEEARKQIERRGGRLLWQGRVRFTLIGGEEWDVVALVQYPTAHAFLEMLQDRDYKEAGKHRSAGLADTRLIACEAIAGSGGSSESAGQLPAFSFQLSADPSPWPLPDAGRGNPSHRGALRPGSRCLTRRSVGCGESFVRGQEIPRHASASRRICGSE